MIKALCGLFCCLALNALAAPREGPMLTLCYEDQDSYPWVMEDGSGLNLQLLRLVEQAQHGQFTFIAVPWKRCLAGLAQGTYDGAFAASYKAERLSLGRYPLDADGRLDERKRLHTSIYALYRRKGSPVSWNGQEFRQLQGRIGSLSGFSIVDFIRAQGAEVDETSRDPLALLRMLSHKRIEAAALQSLRGDFVLQANLDLAAQLEKLELPLEDKAYYLMLSNDYVASNPEQATALWDEIERQRESPTYQQQVQAFIARPQP
ncbi:substrate-binding periplasmic protein [Pseudomonas sp. GLN_6]|uniref:substrate-binding periplasmic protein n=1 Tax=Pseudomonas sp. GLN_6 TaxID=3367183 RepID=UPI00370B9120